MEQAIIALVSLSLTLTIYLDRTRRVDMAAGFARLDGRINDVRTETTAGFARLDGRIDDLRDELRTEMTAGFARLDGRIDELRTEMDGRTDDLRKEMHAGFAAQTTALVDLAQSVGRVEGRTETLVAAE